ncbi:IclR family transcriptional regulator [Tissierella carlieri]|jgi:DNA-binding IclR family transcriptional regulator|uniref:IclR family transcriptional regulator n=1 Tax=Tissierella carlieri TaxID=689904 RepID=UPI001C0F6EE7|nr:IclR family transcriptional regulator [Tissierella carlieri]MBU5310893.1 IclR family transcriptional regulator [Tissierella carlieri]
MKDNYSSIDKAFLILENLAVPPYEKTALEISEELKIHRSTVHRILNILIENKMVHQSPSSKKYSIGPGSYHIGAAYLYNHTSMEQIRIILEELAKEIKQSIGYAILLEDRILSLFELESYQPIQIGFKVGTYYPIHCGAYGKCIMAYYEPYDRLEEIVYSSNLEKKGPNTITDPKQLLQEYSSIRQQGFAISDEENMKGLVGIGVPVKNFNDKVTACIAVKYIKGNIVDAERDMILGKLMHYADRISKLNL